MITERPRWPTFSDVVRPKRENLSKTVCIKLGKSKKFKAVGGVEALIPLGIGAHDRRRIKTTHLRHSESIVVFVEQGSHPLEELRQFFVVGVVQRLLHIDRTVPFPNIGIGNRVVG